MAKENVHENSLNHFVERQLCVENSFEFPPWCDQLLQFRIQIEAKQLKFCLFYSMPIQFIDSYCNSSFNFIRFLSLYCRALPYVYVCTANQMNFMRNGNAYNVHTHACLHVLPSTISAPPKRISKKNIEKKKTTAKLLSIVRSISMHFPWPYSIHSTETFPYLWVFYSNFAFIDRRRKIRITASMIQTRAHVEH